ncbi:hypothetical protein N9N28_16445 [Rubripirellula amarantea]|uniref:Uncharacterized protein n=1 Tax=Rubripirellula amarantea TaxID=2527999 RepID=A0A5C5WXM8_9BACT|nr:hypothetical protein [Rubripirellula amarantea]MDA8746217.1 hypothetical protein [Rubripirellula amarantea]TWT54881.1 hypothetical protein Pla22_25350 [Rubripirellula amarantea]
MRSARDLVHLFLITAALTIGFITLGCDQRETILDVDTPDGDVVVERDRDDGSISVDVNE